MKLHKIVLCAAIALCAGSLAVAGGTKESASAQPASGSSLTGTYTFGGSTTVQPIANGVIESLVAANPGLKISYEGVGSGTGLKQLSAGTLSLAGASRDLKQGELDSGLVPVVIAKDGIAVVVNKDVSVANITSSDLAGIFSGSITNWNQLGGKDEEIRLINRDEASGTYTSFKEIVLDAAGVEFSKNAIVAKENGEVAAKVASTPGAIGYVGLGFVEEITKSGGKALMIDGIAPSADTVLDGTYPVSRALYVVTNGPVAAGSVEEAFINYALSARGAVIVTDAGFVPLD